MTVRSSPVGGTHVGGGRAIVVVCAPWVGGATLHLCCLVLRWGQSSSISIEARAARRRLAGCRVLRDAAALESARARPVLPTAPVVHQELPPHQMTRKPCGLWLGGTARSSPRAKHADPRQCECSSQTGRMNCGPSSALCAAASPKSHAPVDRPTRCFRRPV